MRQGAFPDNSRTGRLGRGDSGRVTIILPLNLSHGKPRGWREETRPDVLMEISIGGEKRNKLAQASTMSPCLGRCGLIKHHQPPSLLNLFMQPRKFGSDLLDGPAAFPAKRLMDLQMAGWACVLRLLLQMWARCGISVCASINELNVQGQANHSTHHSHNGASCTTTITK